MPERTTPASRPIGETGPIRLHLWPGEGPATLILFADAPLPLEAGAEGWWGRRFADILGWRTLVISPAPGGGLDAAGIAGLLPSILDEAGPVRVTCGYDAGGHAALQFGAALGARVALSLSPRLVPDAAGGDAAGMPVTPADLPAVALAVFDPIAPAGAAQGLILAALPGLLAVPLRHAGEATAEILAESGCLPEVMRLALAGDAAAAAAVLRTARSSSRTMLAALARVLTARGRSRWATCFAAAAESGAADEARRIFAARARGLRRAGRREEEAAVLRAWLDAEPAAEEARLALARSLLALGRTEEAVAMIEAAIAAGPVDPRLRELLVHALRRLKRTNAAIIAARDLTAAAPRQVSAHLLLGETLLWARRLDPARAAFERALRLDPGLRRARLGLALAAEEGGEEPGPALRAAIEGLAAEGAPEEEWLWLLRMLEPLRRPGAAAFAAAQAVQAWPQSLALQEALGAARLAAGDLDGAAQAYRVVAQGRPERVEGWLGLTDALWRAKRFAEGVEVLRAAVARHPDHAVLAVRAASFLLAAGRPEAALREARRAVALDPRLEIAHMTLAEVLHRLHRTGEMIRALEAALEVLPDSAAIAARLGHVQALAEMPARAAESFARAVAAPRAPLHAWVGLVDALLRLDRRAEAEAAARRGLAAYPAARELQARLGQILLDAGDAGAARDALAEALAADQGSETVHLAMADALLRQGRRAEAIAAAREAVAVSGGRPDVAARLGHLLIEAGEIEEAAAIFTRVTAEAPELVTGWVGLSDAERLRKRFREAVAACRRAEAAGADRHTLRMLRFRLYGEMEE